MNPFADLIPQNGRRQPQDAQGQAPAGGLFDDLIPQPPAPSAAAPMAQAPMTQEEASMAILPSQRLAGESDPMVDAIMREPRPEPSGVDRALTAASATLGAPVDAVNAVLDGLGRAGLNVPRASDRPFLGSAQIEDGLQAVTGSRESAEIEARNPGLTQAGGAPIGQRLNFGFMQTPEAERRFFENRFGPENEGWYFLEDPFGNRTSRVVVRNEDGTESLFNPPGLDWGDVAALGGVVPDFVGGVVGATAATPAFAKGPVVGIAATSVGGATGASLASGLVGQFFPENREAETFGELAARKGQDALIDSALGIGIGQTARLASGAFGRVAAPFAESARRGLAPAFRESSRRLRDQGYDVLPLPSQEGAGGFMPRVEGFLEKLPGSSAMMETRRAQGDDALARATQDLIDGATPGAPGQRVVGELEAGRDALLRERDTLLEGADRNIQAGFDTTAARQGPQTSAEAAGQELRGGLSRARSEFRDEADRLYGAARSAPGGTDPIVPTQGLRDRVARIREELPPEATRELSVETGLFDAQGRPIRRTETTGGGPSPEFTPDGLRRFFAGVDDIAEDITIDQARQMRRLLSDAVDDKTVLPGVPDRFLTQMRDELTEAIEGAAQRAGPELRNALTDANAFYSQNRPRFDRAGVRETFRDASQAGFREDNQLVGRLLTGRGNPGLIRETRELMGPNSAEWAAVRRNAWDEITDAGRNQTLYGQKMVDADALVSRLNRMDDETLRELFGVDASQLRSLAADLSNRTRYLDADAISDAGSPSILASLRRAADIEAQVTRDYRDNVIAPFLRGESGARASINPEELVPYLYRSATPAETQQVMARLSPDMRREVERGAVADILSRGMSQGDSVDAVLRLISGEATPPSARSLVASLGANDPNQRSRIDAILSPETRQRVMDLAVVAASTDRQDTVTAAAGGIAAGTAITRMASSPVDAGVKAAIFRGFAEVVTSDWFRRWVTRTERPGLSNQTLGQTAGTGPQTLRALTDLASEYGSADAQAAMNFLMQGSQLGEGGERLSRPPAGFDNWESFFGGDEDASDVTIDTIMR